MGRFEQKLAEQVVRKSLALSEGEEYFIETFQHTLALAEALQVEAAKVGAHPHVMLFTDEAYRRYLAEVPEQYLRKPSPLMLRAYDSLSAMTHLGGPEDPAIFEKMPAERLNALNQAERPFHEKSLERKIRGVGIELGTVTPHRAVKYGLDYDSWSRSVRSALNADLSEIARLGREMAARLEEATEVHVTARNGTDIRFEVAGRKAYVEDGIVDSEDLKKGSFWASLPAGSVSMAPRETTAHGTVVFDRMALWGRVLTNVKWTFDAGVLREYSAGRNRQTWENFYGPATGDKDRIAGFSLGLNARGRPMGYNLTDWFSSGVVGIAIGNNDYLGGANNTTFHWGATVLRATVELDGTEIVSNGRLL